MDHNKTKLMCKDAWVNIGLQQKIYQALYHLHVSRLVCRTPPTAHNTLLSELGGASRFTHLLETE